MKKNTTEHICTRVFEDYRTVGESKGLKAQPNGVIYWHIDAKRQTPDLEVYKTVLAFEKCFSFWAGLIAPIQLQSTADPNKAAIIIRFAQNGNDFLPTPFGKGTLAYAYLPDGESLGFHSDMYFNDDYQWGEMHKEDSYSLFKVAVHEVGHALGIYHSRVKEDIMYPTYQPNNDIVATVDTLGAIEELFAEQKAEFGGSGVILVLASIFPTLHSVSTLNKPTLRRLCGFLGIEHGIFFSKKKLAKLAFERIHINGE